MKYKRVVIAVVFAALAALLLPGLSFADGVAVSVVSPATVSQGDAFTVDANIENATDIFDFQLDLNFDPAVLQAGGVLEGTFLSGGGDTFFIPGVVDNTGGSITFNADTLLSAISGVDGGGMLLQFDFNALAPGTSSLAIENLILQDSQGDLVDASITNGSVTVGSATVPTPEPSSFILLALGVVLCVTPHLLRRGAGRFPGSAS